MQSSGILKLEKAAKLDPLTYGITYIDLLQNQSWDLRNRRWSIDIYGALNPNRIEKYPETEPRQLVLMKPTQIGMSTMAIVRMFHFADFWPSRIIYMLPRQQDYIDFVTTRIDPMIKASPRLSQYLGSPDSTRSKGFKESYLFFMESTVEPRMMPADMLMVDEIDLCDSGNVGTAINRLDNSNWKIREYFGTPTIPNYGSHGRFIGSNMNEWLVKCPSCGHWQEMDWDINLRVIGNPEEPDDLFLGCSKCNHRFNVDEINNYGTWVPGKPDKTDIVGYHVSQLMVFPLKQIYDNWLDPEQTIVEFYRKRLGKPYEIAGGSVSREDILSTCFTEPYSQEKFALSKQDSYFMGVDQGNELQVLIGKKSKDSGVIKIVHAELIPMETVDGSPAGFDKVAKLMKIYDIKKAVIDGNPNRHPVRRLQMENLGRVIIADYVNIKTRLEKKNGKTDKDKNVIVSLSLNRTLTLDDLMQTIRDGEWRMFGSTSNLPPIIETVISQVTALKRDIEPQKKPGGIIENVPVWRKLRPEHFAHAMSYLHAAVEITSGRRGRVVVIGSGGQEEEIKVSEDIPPKNVLDVLLPILSQVRQEQAQLYFELANKKEIDPDKFPQPLRHCYNKAIEVADIKHIEWIIGQIALYDNKPIDPYKTVNKPSGRTIRVA